MILRSLLIVATPYVVDSMFPASVCRSVGLSVCLPVCLAVCLSVCLSVSRFVCLSACLRVMSTMETRWHHPLVCMGLALPSECVCPSLSLSFSLYLSPLFSPLYTSVYTHIGWLRLVGSSKSLVSFAKEPYKRDDILCERRIHATINHSMYRWMYWSLECIHWFWKSGWLIHKSTLCTRIVLLPQWEQNAYRVSTNPS